MAHWPLPAEVTGQGYSKEKFAVAKLKTKQMTCQVASERGLYCMFEMYLNTFSVLNSKQVLLYRLWIGILYALSYKKK